MKHDPLNHQLLEEFPYLKENYLKIKEGVFDLDTPSVNFYQEIFLPYFLQVIQSKDEKEIVHCCTFIENLLCDEDEKSNILAMNGILCPLYESRKINFDSIPFGTRAKSYYENWLMEK
jgi:hypothetical protein